MPDISPELNRFRAQLPSFGLEATRRSTAELQELQMVARAAVWEQMLKLGDHPDIAFSEDNRAQREALSSIGVLIDFNRKPQAVLTAVFTAVTRALKKADESHFELELERTRSWRPADVLSQYRREETGPPKSALEDEQKRQEQERERQRQRTAAEFRRHMEEQDAAERLRHATGRPQPSRDYSRDR